MSDVLRGEGFLCFLPCFNRVGYEGWRGGRKKPFLSYQPEQDKDGGGGHCQKTCGESEKRELTQVCCTSVA